MLIINIHKTKTHLPLYIEEVAADEEVDIMKAGKPAAYYNDDRSFS